MRYLLAIKTVIPKPGGRVWYDDQLEAHDQIYDGDDGIDYAFMGSDPNAADNQWLRFRDIVLIWSTRALFILARGWGISEGSGIDERPGSGPSCGGSAGRVEASMAVRGVGAAGIERSSGPAVTDIGNSSLNGNLSCPISKSCACSQKLSISSWIEF